MALRSPKAKARLARYTGYAQKNYERLYRRDKDMKIRYQGWSQARSYIYKQSPPGPRWIQSRRVLNKETGRYDYVKVYDNDLKPSVNHRVIFADGHSKTFPGKADADAYKATYAPKMYADREAQRAAQEAYNRRRAQLEAEQRAEYARYPGGHPNANDRWAREGRF